MTKEEAKKYLKSKEGSSQMEYIMFAQEKYSNGETSMQYFDEFLQPDALYLLDEPEVSLSPANQVILAEEINKISRLFRVSIYYCNTFTFYAGNFECKNI